MLNEAKERNSTQIPKIGINTINPELIAGIIGTTLHELGSGSRKGQMVFKRHLFCWLLKRNTRMSLSEIGKLINRDHASVIHACKSIDNYIELNYRNAVERIEQAQKTLDELKNNPVMIANECIRMAERLERIAYEILNSVNG